MEQPLTEILPINPNDTDPRGDDLLIEIGICPGLSMEEEQEPLDNFPVKMQRQTQHTEKEINGEVIPIERHTIKISSEGNAYLRPEFREMVPVHLVPRNFRLTLRFVLEHAEDTGEVINMGMSLQTEDLTALAESQARAAKSQDVPSINGTVTNLFLFPPKDIFSISNDVEPESPTLPGQVNSHIGNDSLFAYERFLAGRNEGVRFDEGYLIPNAINTTVEDTDELVRQLSRAIQDNWIGKNANRTIRGKNIDSQSTFCAEEGSIFTALSAFDLREVSNDLYKENWDQDRLNFIDFTLYLIDKAARDFYNYNVAINPDNPLLIAEGEMQFPLYRYVFTSIISEMISVAVDVPQLGYEDHNIAFDLHKHMKETGRWSLNELFNLGSAARLLYNDLSNTPTFLLADHYADIYGFNLRELAEEITVDTASRNPLLGFAIYSEELRRLVIQETDLDEDYDELLGKLVEIGLSENKMTQQGLRFIVKEIAQGKFTKESLVHELDKYVATNAIHLTQLHPRDVQSFYRRYGKYPYELLSNIGYLIDDETLANLSTQAWNNSRDILTAIASLYNGIATSSEPYRHDNQMQIMEYPIVEDVTMTEAIMLLGMDFSPFPAKKAISAIPGTHGYALNPIAIEALYRSELEQTALNIDNYHFEEVFSAALEQISFGMVHTETIRGIINKFTHRVPNLINEILTQVGYSRERANSPYDDDFYLELVERGRQS